jgi:hypothetical protein
MAPQRRSPISMSMAGAALACVVLVAAGCGSSSPAATQHQATTSATTVPATAATPTAMASTTPESTTPPPAAMQLLWESSGDGGTTGAQPATYSPAIDPLTGDIWVAVSFDGTIWRFSKDGEYLGSFGTPGKGDGEFNFVRSVCSPCGAGAMAFAPDGTLFVADDGNNRIEKFDPRHKFVKAWGSFGAGHGQFADANQIATNGHEVFVSDDARVDTQVFDMDGTYLRTIPTAGWLAVDDAGNVHIDATGTVTTYHPDGTTVGQSITLPPYHGAEHIGLALDGKGRLFFDLQAEPDPHPPLALGSIDLATNDLKLYASAGETIAIHGDVLYEANFVTDGWPKAVLRAYQVPAP